MTMIKQKIWEEYPEKNPARKPPFKLSKLTNIFLHHYIVHPSIHPIRKLVHEFMKVKNSCLQEVDSLQDDLGFPLLARIPGLSGPLFPLDRRGPGSFGNLAIASLWRIYGLSERRD